MFYRSAVAICTLSFTSLFVTGKPLAATSPYSQLSTQFSRDFQQQLKKNNVPGGAFVIVEGSQILALGTYGKRSKNSKLPITANTVFRLASVSKTFAGTLTGMLVAEKKLDWQQPIVSYVPEFTLAPQHAAKKITLAHVVGHSTGLWPNSYDNLINANVTIDKVIDKFKELTPMCQPGRCYGYQNVVFSFIESALEQQTNLSYQTLLQQRIFDPLNMHTASLGYAAFQQASNRAEPHIKTKLGFKQVKVKPNYYQLAPAAGVNASITDMSKWLMANLGEKPDVISSALLDDLTTPGIKTTKELRRRDWRQYLDSAHYGKGWRIYQFEGKPLIYHAGWVAGYVAEIAYSPDLNLGLVVLLNGESRAIAKLSANFWREAFLAKSHKKG